MTANAPITPPGGAHHGMDASLSEDGNGEGTQSQRQPRRATIGTNDTRLASHGFSSAPRNALFMGGPHAIRAIS